MLLSELDFELPASSIAQRPLEERDASRMLLVDRASGAWRDAQFNEFPQILSGGELVVVNNARVMPARLFGRRAGQRAEPPGANNPELSKFLSSPIEVMLVRPLGPGMWEALVRPGRKVPVGERILFGEGELEAIVEGRGEFGLRVLRFTSKEDFTTVVGRLGHIPLPPYIKRSDDARDRERYQTVFARHGNAFAAPTAGLHFSKRILEGLEARAVKIAEITLEVGLGTFEPVRTERLEDHKIHSEWYEIDEAAANAIEEAKSKGRPIVAIGTTVVRALEDAALKAKPGHPVTAGRREADIFLYPGKPFRIVNQLLTNFHLPRSSLLGLVAAFAGRENVLKAYRHAVDSEYRFYSYGDCMFIR
jgi:S-adenosylmethionine:tRNA ribosyltransferase-isomerase